MTRYLPMHRLLIGARQLCVTVESITTATVQSEWRFSSTACGGTQDSINETTGSYDRACSTATRPCPTASRCALESEFRDHVGTVGHPSATRSFARPESQFMKVICRNSSTSSATGASSMSEASTDKQYHKIEFSPISRAVALLLSQHSSSNRHRIVESMSKLCLEMAGDIKQYSPTELAAFCETAKKLDFCTQALADSVMEYFAGKVSLLNEEELLGVIWVVAQKEDMDSALARDLGDAVMDHLDDMRLEDFPDLLSLMASISPASPFLLTSIAEEILSRLKDFSPAEVTALVETFGSEVVRRSLFDDVIFKKLAAHTMKQAHLFKQPELLAILNVFRIVCPRRHSLVGTLSQMEQELAPLITTDPS